MPEENQNNPLPASFEEWLKGQGADVQTLYQTHTQGLRSALDSERDNRKTVEKQLREEAKKSEAGSAAQKQLTETADRLAAMERQTAFYDRAHAAGVKNLRLAFLAAQEAQLVSEKGEVDFDKLKKEFPELFGAGSNSPRGNSGDGTGNPQPGKVSMDDIIRKKAGVI